MKSISYYKFADGFKLSTCVETTWLTDGFIKIYRNKTNFLNNKKTAQPTLTMLHGTGAKYFSALTKTKNCDGQLGSIQQHQELQQFEAAHMVACIISDYFFTNWRLWMNMLLHTTGIKVYEELYGKRKVPGVVAKFFVVIHHPLFKTHKLPVEELLRADVFPWNCYVVTLISHAFIVARGQHPHISDHYLSGSFA